MTFERPGDAELSLRRRKKLQSQRRIQRSALELVGESSYDAVTIEEIAAKSEVSPSTVYRYFQTKEGIFLWDEYDEAVLEEFERRLAETNPIEAMNKAVARIFSRRLDPELDVLAIDQMTLIDEVPQLRHSFTAHLDDLRHTLASEVADAGWPAVESAVFAGAMVGAILGGMEAWMDAGAHEPMSSVVDRATGMVAEGFDTVFGGQ
ncbi:MAG: TetR/AcrR family transcriptional regulator [Acidimicrobiia bacterium]